jgi:hypothetical protein
VNLSLLTIGFLIPVVHEPSLGSISYLHILSALLLFLPGVVFQAVNVPGKLPGLLLYLGGLLSLISLVTYTILGILTSLGTAKKPSFPALILLILSEIGAIAVLFLWQDYLAPGAWLMAVMPTSCFLLEIIDRGSVPSRAER